MTRSARGSSQIRLILTLLVAVGLMLTTALRAHAALVLFDGAQFDLSGTWIVTAGSHLGDTGSFIGEFTLGPMETPTTWSIAALSAGGIDAPLVPLTLSPGFVLDSSNDTLVGTGTSPTFLGGGGDTRQVTVTFIDGNTTTDTFINADLTNPDNGRSGTFTYGISPVPEPGSLLLLGSGLAGLAARRKWWNT